MYPKVLEGHEDVSQKLNMVCECFRPAEDIVKVWDAALIPQGVKHFLHTPLKCGRGIRKSKRDAHPLIQTPCSDECRHVSRPLCNETLMIGFSLIQDGEPAVPPERVDEILNTW